MTINFFIRAFAHHVNVEKTMPSTRVERVTFPLQVERATTTPTRHHDRSILNTAMTTSFPNVCIGPQDQEYWTKTSSLCRSKRAAHDAEMH
jgi:hypothetical protein